MNVNRSLLLLAWVMALTAFPAATEAGDINWKQVIGDDPTTLTSAQSKRAIRLLEKISNTSGCQGSISHCLNGGDSTARRHAGFVLRMIRRNKSDEYIEEGVKKRQSSVNSNETAVLDLTDSPRKGPADAPIVLVEYACFECPACANLAPDLGGLVKRFNGQVVLYFKFFPVRSHPRAIPAALTAYAAFRMGKFWEMHDQLYANRSNLSDNELERYAQENQLEINAYRTFVADPSSVKQIERDKLEGMRHGVEGTPTIFVNGRKFEGPYLIEEIIDRLEIESERLGLTPPQ